MLDERSVAVFVGPSLDQARAAELLPGQLYLPPARFGDVYRLIGGGVRAILLLDGVFHLHAPVWQRELLAALHSGIRVYGAASMGALRAVELAAYGMVGIGTVYEWFASGKIDGDDEVALLHADSEQRYRALSVPLVHWRFNLERAVARGLVEAAWAAELLRQLKALPYWERDANAVWASQAVRELTPGASSRLRQFVSSESVDVKAMDAAWALADVARAEADPKPGASILCGPALQAPLLRERHRLPKRTFPGPGSTTIEGRALADRILCRPERRVLLRASLAARFFGRSWAIDAAARAGSALDASPPGRPTPEWLRANALTEREFVALHRRAAADRWLAEQMPEDFGGCSALAEEALLAGLPEIELAALSGLASRAVLAAWLPYVALWASSVCAAPAPDERARLAERWSASVALLRAREPAAVDPFIHAIWVLWHGPVYFGFASWSLTTELLSELQLAGGIDRLSREAGGVFA